MRRRINRANGQPSVGKGGGEKPQGSKAVALRYSRQWQSGTAPRLEAKRKAARNSRRLSLTCYNDEGWMALELEAQAKLHDAREVRPVQHEKALARASRIPSVQRTTGVGRR